MSVEFVDTNVLLYILENDVRKAARAKTLLLTQPVISVQVLNEAASAARRKMRLDWPRILDFLAELRAYVHVSAVTIATHDSGLRLAERYQLSVYDAMIVAAALEAGCATLWSEDMHDGLLVDDRLTIRNPFARGLA